MTSTTTTASAPQPTPVARFQPFPDAPQLRGPLSDGTYCRPASGMTTMFYKFADTDRQWYWTPDQEKTFWMPCSTIIVNQGPFNGKKPAYFNVEIIEFLNQHRPAPPAGAEVADLEWLKEDMTKNPPASAKPKGSETAKLNATLGNINVQATAVVRNESRQTTTLDAVRVKTSDTLVFKGCRDGTYTVTGMHTKLVIDECVGCKFFVNAKVISAVADLYKCENIELHSTVAIKTLQVDNCTNVKVKFVDSEHFHSVVWAGTKQLEVNVKHTKELQSNTGVDVIRAKHPTMEIRDDIDQFITRIIDSELLTERVIRLPNGFPSTQREKDEFDARQERNMQAFAKNAGLTFVRTKHVGDKAPPRNSPCTCGSGKKYKVCCGANDDQGPENL